VATDAEKIARLEREIEELKAENERLRRALEEALRSAKRQAAPFSRRHPKAHPQKPGRKAGAKYGRRGRRKIPEKVDETVEVPLPQQCPQCGGRLKETELVSQYQTEIPEPRVERIEFRIHVGHCRQCGARVQGRHPRQTSQAVGSAASQLGARALALATYLNKGLGRQDSRGAGGSVRTAGEPGRVVPRFGTDGAQGGADLRSDDPTPSRLAQRDPG
jgi:transposase